MKHKVGEVNSAIKFINKKLSLMYERREELAKETMSLNEYLSSMDNCIWDYDYGDKKVHYFELLKEEQELNLNIEFVEKLIKEMWEEE